MPSDATVRRRQRLWALGAALVLVAGLALWFKPAIFGLGNLRAQRDENAKSVGLAHAPASSTDRVAQASPPVPNSSANAESLKPANLPSSSTTATSPSSSATTGTESKSSGEPISKGSHASLKLPAKNASASRASARDAADSITLEIHATSEVWVSAMSDGVSVLNFTLHAGESRQLRASNHLILKTGNAAALDVSFNGKPLPPLGQPNQVRTLTFTPSGLQ